MIRTTTDLVAGIIDLDVSIPLDPFIQAANLLVDKITPDLGDTTMEVVERWLSAHFYCMRDPRRTSEKAGSVAASYQSKVDLNLYLSHYGQMAMVLDTTGTLRALSHSRKKTRLTWLGATPVTSSEVF